jgi:hypothetical protein
MPNRSNWKILLGLGLVAPALAGLALAPSVASDSDDDAAVHADHADHPDASGLHDELAEVRRATAKYHRLDAALDAGYELGWVNGAGVRIVGGCVSHATKGAMGYHYFNARLMADNAVDPLKPEVLVYASTPDGGRRLVAVEWVVRSAQSNPPGVSTAPSVLGMDMHILVPPPGPAFYLAHAWVWANNPAGIFEDWNPEVSCP